MRYHVASNLLSVHREIGAALQEVRLAVMAADPEVAGRHARGLDQRLREHIRHEDELLVPAYVRWVSEYPPHGAPELIVGEHRRLEQLLERLGAALAAWPRSSGAEAWLECTRVGVALAELLEHHDQREADSLFPALDAAVPPSALRELLDAVEATESPRVPAEVPSDVYAALVPRPLLRPVEQLLAPLGAAEQAPRERSCLLAEVVREGHVALAIGDADGLASCMEAALRCVRELALGLRGTAGAAHPVLAQQSAGQLAKMERLVMALAAGARDAGAQQTPRARRLALLRGAGAAATLERLVSHHHHALWPDTALVTPSTCADLPFAESAPHEQHE